MASSPMPVAPWKKEQSFKEQITNEEEEDLDDDFIIRDQEFEGFKELVWENGDEYTGHWRGGFMHGKGMLSTGNGIYQGEMVMHEMHGFGRMDFNDGEIYVGEWKGSLFNGKGVLGYNEFSAYEGEFMDGKRHGFGTMQWENEDVFEGRWVEGERNGHGLYVAHYKTEVYKGSFKNGKRHGKGEVWMTQDGAEYHSGEYLKLAVEHEEGELIRKRSRPASKPPWPEKNAIMALEAARQQEIDIGAPQGENKVKIITGSAQNNTNAESIQEMMAQINREAEEEAEDEAFLNNFGAANKMEYEEEVEEEDPYADAPSLAEINKMKAKRESSLEQWHEADGDEEEADMLRLLRCCIPKKKKEQVDRRASIIEFGGKVDSLLVVRLEKATDLPTPSASEPCNPHVVLESRGGKEQSHKLQDQEDPVWKEIFEFQHGTGDTERNLVCFIYHTKISGQTKLLGTVEVLLDQLKPGQKVKSKAFTMKDARGKEVIGNTQADGKKPKSQLFLTYWLTVKPDALLSVRLLGAKDLKAADPLAIGTPFAVVHYGHKQQKSQAGKDHSNPKWNQTVSFEVLSESSLASHRAIERETKIIVEVWDYQMLAADTFIGSIELSIEQLAYGTKDNIQWYAIEDNTRTGRTTGKIGSVQVQLSWGSNELTALRIHIEEGFNLTPYISVPTGGLQALTGLLYGGGKEEAEKHEDPNKHKMLADSFMKITFDAKRSKKTKVIKQSLDPGWDEKTAFTCKRSELPSSIAVECYHQTRGGFGSDEFIGMTPVTLSELELDGISFVRWYSLRDPELDSLVKERERQAERQAYREQMLLKGIFIEDDPEEEQEEEEEEEYQISKQHGFFSRFMGNVAKGPNRRHQLLTQLHVGKDPEELGRVKIRLSWVSVDDEEDKACQRLWDEKMRNRKYRAVLKRVMMKWVTQILTTAFQKLLRIAQITKQQAEQSAIWYKERALPRFFNAWNEFLSQEKVAMRMQAYYNQRNVLKPVLDAWQTVVNAAKRRAKIASGEWVKEAMSTTAPLDLLGTMQAGFLSAAADGRPGSGAFPTLGSPAAGSRKPGSPPAGSKVAPEPSGKKKKKDKG